MKMSFMSVNVRMINALCNKFGKINNMEINKYKKKEMKTSTNNISLFINVPNAFKKFLNIVHRDVVSKIGLKNINLNAVDNHLLHEIQSYFLKFKELNRVLLLLKKEMKNLVLVKNK
jgi:predicted ATP-dependent serine protease